MTSTGSSSALLTPEVTHDSERVDRSAADRAVRRMLRISEPSPHLDAPKAEQAFRRSMAISAVRCTLTYLVFPFALPAFGLVANTGVLIGLIIGTLAIVCDVFAIRRFFTVDHKWRWHFSAIALTVVSLLAILLIQDVIQLTT
jgi:hypothetical protein